MARRSHSILFITVLVAVLYFALVQPAMAEDKTKTPAFSMLVVFGDSNVDGGLADPGSMFDRSGGKFPRKPHVGGRYTNGPMVAEYLAEMLNIPIQNYAVSAATTGDKNLFDSLLPEGMLPRTKRTGVLMQIAEYRRDLGGAKADPKTLFIYWAGSNDIYKATSKDLDERIANAGKNIEMGLTQLVELGAERIFVATRTARPKLDSENNAFGIRLNEVIAKTVKAANEKLSADIELFDAYAITADMKKNPGSYGFVETAEECKKNPECLSRPEVAASYVQWDNAHVTTRAHKILADAIFRQLDK